jgi:hypothetical protein
MALLVHLITIACGQDRRHTLYANEYLIIGSSGVFTLVSRIAKAAVTLSHVCPSVYPNGTTRLPLNVFS